MELLLNLLWFAIAAGALLVWLPISPSHRRQFRLGLGALLCVLALLLPAISVTDDLHFDTFAVEDSSSSKRLANAPVHVSPISHVVWFAILLVAFLLVVFGPTWLPAALSSSRRPDFCFGSPILGRAPPFVLA
ncbi:MAG TPA: hypothetical protein VLW06_05900 [Terriglobales bacterium]|nr:hypothetical protein [Terriglobales bacterium]